MDKFCLAIALALTACAAPGVTESRHSFTATTEIQGTAIVAIGDATVLGGWTGTGWYIATDGNNSVVATAGHVCVSRGDVMDGVAEVVLPIYATETAEAHIIYDHDTAPDDTCLLYVPVAAPDVIKIGPDPVTGDEVSYVGYPNGMLGAFRGVVIGQETKGEEAGYVAASIPAYYGASGSAVVNEAGEAIGLISRGDIRFTNRAWLVPIERLRAARDYAEAFLVRMRTDGFKTAKGVLVGTEVHRDQKAVD